MAFLKLSEEIVADVEVEVVVNATGRRGRPEEDVGVGRKRIGRMGEGPQEQGA